MKMKLSALAVALGVATSAPAFAESPYTNLYAFGDSLTDSGTFGGKATNQDLATGEYAKLGVERFADTIMAPNFTNAYNLDMATFAITVNGGTNYSVGGYNTSDVLTSILGADIVFPQQSNPAAAGMTYVGLNGSSVDKNAIYYVSGGGNDFLQGMATDTASVTTSVTRLITGASYLGSLGAQYIVVPNLVALEFAPGVQAGGPVFAATAAAGAEGFNDLLELMASSSEYNIIVTDTHLAMREFFADTQAYGFALTGDLLSQVCYVGCLPSDSPMATGLELLDSNGMVNPNANVDFFAFNDPIHPTGAGHAIFSVQLDSVFTAPDVFGSMPQVVLSDSRDQVESVRSQMTSLRHSDQGMGLILAGGYTEGDWGADLHMGADREMTSYTAGLHAPVGDNSRVAVALTSNNTDVNYGSSYSSDQYAGVDAGMIKSSGMGVVVSASHTMGSMFFEVTPELMWGSMDTARDLRLLAFDREQTASTDFVSAGITLASGWDMMSSDTVAFGPMLEYSYRNVTVDGFAENEMNSNALNVSQQKWNESLVGGGLFANYQAGNFFIDASARYLVNLDDGRETVNMAVQSIASNTFWLPTQMRTDEITEAELSAGYNWCNVMVKGSYRYQDAGSQGENDMFSVSASYAF